MSNQDEGWCHAGSLEQRVQFLRDAARRARHWTTIAPSEPGAIVAADARKPRELRLHERPADRRPAERSVENDRRGSLASAVNVETESTDVHKPARRREVTHRFRIRSRLVNIRWANAGRGRDDLRS